MGYTYRKDGDAGVNEVSCQWRITKYDPSFRDENGFYTLQEEWTCPSEIGKYINGEEFTLQEYLCAETAYIDSLIAFLTESGLKSLRILQHVSIEITTEERSSSLYEPAFDETIWQEDQILNENEIRTVSKMVLRNFMGCQLYAAHSFFVHFGWDYYMYIGSSKQCPTSIEIAEKNGLFVEELQSPYHLNEKEITRVVEWFEKDGDHLLVGEEVLVGIPLEVYRTLFNLSENHPVTGTFKITQAFAEFVKDRIDHQIDMDTYGYQLWCSN